MTKRYRKKLFYNIMIECIYNQLDIIESDGLNIEELSSQKLEIYRNTWMQRTFNLRVDEDNEQIALESATKWCKENSTDNKKYEVLLDGVYKKGDE